MSSSATGMATDKELIKEAGQELWNTVKKQCLAYPKKPASAGAQGAADHWRSSRPTPSLDGAWTNC